MKLSAKHSIEPLEARIAPARTIIAGVPNGLPGNDVDYTDTYAPLPGSNTQDPDQAILDDSVFLDTVVEAMAGDNKIAGKVSDVNDPVGLTYYLRMSAGDVLKVYNDQTSTTDPYLTVSSGNIIAFFIDKDGDNEVDEDELTGISMGKNAKIVLKSGVAGDIVANLNELGTSSTADDELDMTGLISDKQSIGGIQVTGGRIDGSIIAGGNITNVVVAGTVGAILAGTAADGKAFDFFPDVEATLNRPAIMVAGGEGLLSVTAAAGKAGASITNIFVDGLGTPGATGVNLNGSLNGVLEAGGGGIGGKGGVVTFVRIAEDADGMTIRGGAGGDSGPSKPTGGAGGAVSRIYIGGFPDPNDTVETVLIEGGAGGAGNLTTGRGGAGGALKDIFVGYQFFGTKPFATDDLLIDQVELLGGAGGNGKFGGAGGSITTADIRVETPEGIDDEISIIGGAGGESTAAGGKAGAGGNLLNIAVRNQDLAAGSAYADTYLQGGQAGIAAPGSLGAAGGNITNVTMLSWEMRLIAGNGSDGKVGGHGGSISKVLIVENDEILTIGARFDAGFGGAATAGAGGKGGNVNGILFTDSDLRDLIINGGSSAANGGLAIGGKGGLGGAVTNVEVRDNNVSNGATQTPVLQPGSVRTGTGGDGSKGGGNGGLMKLLSVDSTNMNVVLETGAGGNVTGGAAAKGKGGAGGTLDTVSVTTRDLVAGVPAFTTAVAGAGGAGAGNGGAGGAGGDLKFVTLSSAGTGSLEAGKGGNGVETAGAVKGGAAGRGGNIVVSQLTARGGDGEIIAGDAGDTGAKAGAGGGILGQNSEVRTGLFASNNLTIQAGDGTNGGAGGSVKFVGYGSGVITLSPTPFGNIIIAAGNGSAEGKIAGVGGSVFDVGGSLPSIDPANATAIFNTTITAGHGGSTAAKGAAGGSVSEIAILTGGFEGSVLTVQAGDAGDSPLASTGAKGGDVKNVTVSSVDLGTIFRSVVAGDGGDAQKKGGAGGNIDGIFVDGLDIGDRSDKPFGLTQMGGLFAGVAGEAAAGTAVNVNGKVTNIVAKGIASIVAGHGVIPQAVEFVDKITLSGDNMLTQADLVFTGHGAFRLSYDAFVNATETTPGDAVTNEAQQILLWELQDAGAQIVYSFNGVSAATSIAGNATDQQVEDALNAISTVVAAGGVTVDPVAGGFSIVFNTPGNKTGVVSLEATSETPVIDSTASEAEVEAELNALPTIQYLGVDPVTGAPKPGAAAVDVDKNVNGGFYVNYGVKGNVLPLEGIEVFSATIDETIAGSITDTVATEQTPGANDLLVTELQPGGGVLFVEENVAGTASDPERQLFDVRDYVNVAGAQVKFGFSVPFSFLEPITGDQTTSEQQTFNMTAIKADPNATFSLQFAGVSTLDLPFNASPAAIQAAANALVPIQQAGGVTATLNAATNVLTLRFNQTGARADFSGVVNSTATLPATADEIAYETALNGMASIRFTAVDQVSGAVDVTPVPPGSLPAYYVDFLEDGDQPLLTLEGLAQERQEIETQTLEDDAAAEYTLSFSRTYLATEIVRGTTLSSGRERQDITLGPVLNDANSTFTISYDGVSTGPLAATASNVDIQNAINALGQGNVTVQRAAGTGTLQITFVTSSDRLFLFSAEATSTTSILAANADEAAVAAQLNGLATIKGPGAVAETVSVARQGVGDTDFEVTFQSLGDRELITASVVTKEVQQVDVTPIAPEPTGSFRLGFGGEFTAEFDPATVTVADIQTALNNLPGVVAAGGATVTESATNVYEVTFGNKGPQEELIVRFEVDEVQEVDFTAGKLLTLTVVNNVLGVESFFDGLNGPQEVQTLRLGDVIGSAAEFTLSYGGESTIALPGTASEAEIDAALEQLTTIPKPAPGDPAELDGGVTVTKTATEIVITFTTVGDQPDTIVARASQSVEVPDNATEADFETALNGLATTQASGNNATGGSVDVTVGTGSNITVRFSSGGNQELIAATQEQALQVFTIREGGNVFNEIQAFSPQPKGQPLDAAYAVANLIGFYSDHTEIDANVFHFYQGGVGGTLTNGRVAEFMPGDLPLDGILFAKKVNQGGLNVVPEAYRIGNDFFDWNNII